MTYLLRILLALSLGTVAGRALFSQSVNKTTSASFQRIHHVNLPHNAASCADCHAIPALGGSSRVTVIRVSEQSLERNKYPGQSETLHTRDEVRMSSAMDIKALRVAINLLGDGYIEAVPEEQIAAISASQSRETYGKIHGECSYVTLPEQEGGQKIVGRFGWKAQHGSLVSAVAEALNSELGEPNRLFPALNSFEKDHDPIAKAMDDEDRELESITTFLRSTDPILPDPERSATDSAKAGSLLFEKVGCAICHVRTFTTVPEGTKILERTLAVSERLGSRIIHPFSDFLLHDIGTGDGLTENIRPHDYKAETANKFRTAPLWGVRYRSWLMHDGKSITYHQAIMRHANEASGVVQKYVDLTPGEKEQLKQFLDSL